MRYRPGTSVAFLSLTALIAMLLSGGPAQASPLFSDGFESGDLSAWTASSGFAVQQHVVSDGSWAGRATTAGPAAWVSTTLSKTEANLYADVHVDLLSVSGTVQFLRFMGKSGTRGVIGLGATKGGKLVLKDFVTGLTSTSKTFSIGTGAWHEVQLHAAINGDSSQVEVWLDHVKVIGLSGTYSLGTTYVARVVLGTINSTAAFDIAFDDTIFDTKFIETPASPIRHVVIVFQENHSFDDVLGKLCAGFADGMITGHDQCDGATQGKLSRGEVIPLSQEPDVVPDLQHNATAQQTAIDSGKMDGFDQVQGCTALDGYACYTQFDPSQIPNLAALATNYVVSDRTFEFAATPSWAGHMVLASARLDGFQGVVNPEQSAFTTQTGPGWGCDSFNDALWWNGTKYVLKPSCIPDRNGNGPYRSSRVRYVPTIFDRLDASGLSWKIYGGHGGPGPNSGYGWAICPTFYECLGSTQRNNLVKAADVVTDAQAGNLPNLSIVTPVTPNSQHNFQSMAVGDNWIGQVVSAIENGPDWSSTAIFIAYDDCGCFYDHVAPPTPDAGIRVPMVIVSPYANAGFTDSNTATFMSMLAFTEHTFGLQPLASSDGNAYDYSASFDYSQTPLSGPKMVTTHVSRSELAYIRAHPSPEDDPT